MNWMYDSSSRIPALQAQSPEFKLQSHQKDRQIKKTSDSHFPASAPVVPALGMVRQEYRLSPGVPGPLGNIVRSWGSVAQSYHCSYAGG
jgi:hypothetical protein